MVQSNQSHCFPSKEALTCAVKLLIKQNGCSKLIWHMSSSSVCRCIFSQNRATKFSWSFNRFWCLPIPYFLFFKLLQNKSSCGQNVTGIQLQIATCFEIFDKLAWLDIFISMVINTLTWIEYPALIFMWIYSWFKNIFGKKMIWSDGFFLVYPYLFITECEIGFLPWNRPRSRL